MDKAKCGICGWIWTPRTEKPCACPSCKRYDWNKPSAVMADLSKNGQTPKKMK